MFKAGQMALAFVFDNGLGKLALGAAGLVAMMGLYSCDRASQRSVGAEAEKVKTERAANANVEKAIEVRRARSAPNAGGVLDPFAKSD